MQLKKTVTVGSTVLASVLALAASASADVQIRTDLRPGDSVGDGALGAVVPEPGQSVNATAVRDDGTTETLAVTTRRDGTVVVDGLGVTPSHHDKPGEPGLLEESPGECEDGAYLRQTNYYGKHRKWKSIMNWWYRAGSTPTEDVDVDSARSAIRRGVRNLVTSRNNCGMSDQVSASQDFQGDTTTGTDISFSNERYWTECDYPDLKNVVEFGWLPDGWLSLTCNWALDDGGEFLRIDSADIRLNEDGGYLWYTQRPLQCVYPYWYYFDIEAHVTMTAGFAYGLTSVPEEGHEHLTMSAGFGHCSSAESTLGKGDIWGLRSMY